MRISDKINISAGHKDKKKKKKRRAGLSGRPAGLLIQNNIIK